MPDDKKSQWEGLYEAFSLGFLFPVAIGLGFGAGWGLDKLFGTRPWLTFIGTGLGIAAAFVNLFRAGKGIDAGPGKS